MPCHRLSAFPSALAASGCYDGGCMVHNASQAIWPCREIVHQPLEEMHNV